MAKVKSSNTSGSSRRVRPAIGPEARENQLIARAYDLAEQRLIDGTATSQEVTHFLKLGARKARLELEILEEQKKLITAKTEALKSQKEVEKLYAEALKAMRNYNGQGEPDEY